MFRVTVANSRTKIGGKKTKDKGEFDGRLRGRGNKRTAGRTTEWRQVGRRKKDSHPKREGMFCLGGGEGIERNLTKRKAKFGDFP